MNQPELNPQIQQKIGKLQLRINDLLDEFNGVLKAFTDESTELKNKIKDLQAPVKTTSGTVKEPATKN